MGGDKEKNGPNPRQNLTELKDLFFQLGVQYRLKSSVLHGGKV